MYPTSLVHHTTTRKGILGGEVQSRVARSRAKVGDGNCCEGYTHPKIPKLRITTFKGTSSDWVRFENTFVTQVHSQPVPDEEKFGYSLEMVAPKVRGKISNLKPGTLGYKTAWERLQKEYRQTKLVVNANMDKIINLTLVKGNSFEKVREFYEVLSKNYNALQTLGEADTLRGFVMTTLKKLPQV